MEILIGADPEVFVIDGKGNIVPGCGLIPGTKEAPYPVRDGAVQVDGMALEFNIDPARSEDEFHHNITSVYGQLRDMVRAQGFDLCIQPSVVFRKKDFDAQSKESKRLGCDPDFCAYTGEENPPVEEVPYNRGAGGHLHIGFTNGANPHDPEHIMRCITLIKHLDVYLGLPSLCWDWDNNRRMMYGKGGAFRPKDYGVEYRTPSNMWLSSDDLIRYVYRACRKAVERLMAGERLDETGYAKVRTKINKYQYGPLPAAYISYFVGGCAVEAPPKLITKEKVK